MTIPQFNNQPSTLESKAFAVQNVNSSKLGKLRSRCLPFVSQRKHGKSLGNGHVTAANKDAPSSHMRVNTHTITESRD